MHIMNIIFTFYQIVGPLQGLFKVNAGAYGRQHSLHGHCARSEKRLRSPSPCFKHERQFCQAQPFQNPRDIRRNVVVFSTRCNAAAVLLHAQSMASIALDVQPPGN